MLPLFFILCLLVIVLVIPVPGLHTRIGYRQVTSLPPNYALSNEFADILNAADLAEAEKRYEHLKQIFPGVGEEELQQLVRTSPLLLFLETSKLEESVRKLNTAVQYVDPSYLISQRAPGVELLLSVTSSTFDVQKNLADVVQVVGLNYNVTQLIRRVPQVLTSKYLLALKEAVEILERRLACTKMEAVDLVEKFPGLLSFASLEIRLDRLRSSLQRNGILMSVCDGENGVEICDNGNASAKLQSSHRTPTHDAPLKRIVMAVPRVLAQDVTKRCQYLALTYPLWDLPKVARYNPYVLTQKVETLTMHYEALVNELGDEYDVDAMINTMPLILRFATHGLREKAAQLKRHFPPPAGYRSVLERHPQLLVSHSADKIVSQLKKIETVFLTSDTLASAGGVTIIECSSDELAQAPESNSTAESRQDSDRSTAGDQAEFLDLSSIVGGNTDFFLKRFPYMLQLLRSWISEFDDASLAYSVLHAVPTALTKKPASMRPIIKALYGTLAEARALTTNSGQSSADVGRGFLPPATANRPGEVCLALYKALKEAPTLLRQSPQELRSRLSDLMTLFSGDGRNGDSEALLRLRGQVLLANARILTEPFEGLVLRLVLLGRIRKLLLPSPEETVPAAITAPDVELLSAVPSCLSIPVACLLRPFFVYSYDELIMRPEPNSDHDASRVYQLLTPMLECNTKDFIDQLRSSWDEQQEGLIDHKYSTFLQGVARDLGSDEPAEAVHAMEGDQLKVEQSSETEKRVCGLLAHMARSSGGSGSGKRSPVEMRRILESRIVVSPILELDVLLK